MPALELSETIAVETPLGPGDAIIVQLGEHDTFWTVILRTRAIVTFSQSKLLVAKDYTRGRGISVDQLNTLIANRCGT
jgi:hypothetical protein